MADNNETNVSGFGVKKSEFNAQGATAIDSNATFDFVDQGTNKKITLTNLLTNFGVTGTIVQDGAVTGTPVLDTQGTVNNIRNLENGSGVKASVSPENGIILDHNFIEDSSGAKLVVDLTVEQPKFRSIVAGAGISVGVSNGTIQIAESGAPTSTKTVIINSISDLPAAVAGVITLADETEYLFTNDITTSSRFVLGNDTVISGSDNLMINVEYTGVGIMFTSLNKSWTAKNITITCSSGTFMDFDGTGVEVLQILESRVIAGTLGTIDDFNGIHFDDTQFTVTTDGFLFGGSNGVILLEANLTTMTAGTLYDLGTATFNAFSVTDSFVVLNGTSVFLDGAASSANLNAGSLGSVHNCRFFGTGTPLQTITVADIRWQFELNDDISDTNRDALMSQVNNVTATTITVATTPVKLAGIWTEEDAFFFTTDSTGTMTFIGEKDIEINVTMSFTAAPVSGTNKAITFYAAKNGTPITNSGATNNLSSGNPSRTTVVWRVSLTNGDYIESFVSNDTDTINVLVNDAVMRVA
jgi:hypothetical protein